MSTLFALALSVSAAAHPLDPLTPSEIARAASALKADARFPKGAFFQTLDLAEPDKATSDPPRRAYAVVLDRPAGRTFEARVDLAGGTVENWEERPGVQPGLMPSELSEAAELARKDPAWRAAMAKRGITDFARVGLDAWAPGAIGLEAEAGRRLARVLSYWKGRSGNFYARPIEGVIAVVDLTHGKVLRVEDSGVVPVAAEDGAYDRAASRPRPKPLEVLQRGGPAFERRGGSVRWLGWRFRFALDAREGPVLYDVAREDRGKARLVLRRASVSEMAVPYGDPAPGWAWRGAFDAGELGAGRLAGPLTAGRDVPAHAETIDAVLANELGEPYVKERALALYERDGGLLWKHHNPEPDSDVARRARELVLTSIATIGNYDYGLSWVFREDGSLDFQVELAGIMLAKGIAPGAEPRVGAAEPRVGAAEPRVGAAEDPYAHRVANGVAAPHHQHFFALRLDFDVDGPANRVYEAAARRLPAGPANKHGNAFAMELRELATETAARRDVDASESRRWLVASEDSAAHGHPAGYLLIPGENAPLFAAPGADIRKRGEFLEHAFWATREKASERYAAGPFPNQAAAPGGVAGYGADDESLVDRDVVVWYTLGVTHWPRPEEWPLMPVHRASVRLAPSGFLSSY